VEDGVCRRLSLCQFLWHSVGCRAEQCGYNMAQRLDEFSQAAHGRAVGYGRLGGPNGDEVAARSESAYGLGVIV